MGNALKTTVLLATLTGLLVVIGDFLGGQSGMLLFFGVCGGVIVYLNMKANQEKPAVPPAAR